ncbi:glycoside hydrolase family 10 protein [Streptomyces griseofuscus]|uniref:Glycosyl hydrolase-like 10 n=1 Tax=Streptomyces griseofuscus TaxID=146922 RepID=A0A7H1Q800_9ACTN|nr:MULTISPECIES: family 10 glycosylhydrolase [Streptomyces]MBA9044846.1 uncharacterized lipoprotein YddW (UPF0748 family) [Streptomyces murinus]QNT96430.1 Glycosyl hydrolase-like 10 [Streptomyces griseofuscus]
MGPISRRAFALGTLSALTTTGCGAATTGAAEIKPPVRRTGAEGATGLRAATEMRGVWMATVENRDWPSRPGLTAAAQQEELIAHLDRAVRNRLNTVLLQVRPTADALWPSPYEPWSQFLTGTQGRDPGWDPLGTAVREAHARGLQLHAWFNPYRIANHTDPGLLAATHPARVHPDWAVPYGGKLYYNPGLPEVRAFVQRAMLDAVARYPVDAVHFDDYFYPYPEDGESFADDDAYQRHRGAFTSRADWRRNNIDLLVQEMAAGIKRVRPAARFGISPFGVWRNASTDPLGSDTDAGAQTYDDLYADTRTWVRENRIDYIAPQLYWEIGASGADYATLLDWWARTAEGTGTRLYIGEALYRAGASGADGRPAAWQDPAELTRHLTLAARRPQVGGHIFFAAQDMADDPIGAMRRVVADHYAQPASPPR